MKRGWHHCYDCNRFRRCYRLLRCWWCKEHYRKVRTWREKYVTAPAVWLVFYTDDGVWRMTGPDTLESHRTQQRAIDSAKAHARWGGRVVWYSRTHEPQGEASYVL